MTPSALPAPIRSRIDTRSGCWLWQGCRKGALPLAYVNGRLVSARRVVWQLLRGELDENDRVLRCRHSDACLRPGHTRAVPVGESWGNRGERHYAARLTDAQAREAWALLESKSKPEIAEMLGVPVHVIRDIARGRGYASVVRRAA